MAIFKKVVLAAVLVCLCFYMTGCVTILGGIIGYQSGELCAGLAIGAALEFGGDIVRGVGEMVADPKKDFRDKSQFNSENGTIILPKAAFTVDRTRKLLNKLKKKLQIEGWSCNTTEKSCNYNAFSKHSLHERLHCEKANGEHFNLTIRLYTDQDPHFLIETPDESGVDRAAMTIQVYKWIEQIVMES